MDEDDPMALYQQAMLAQRGGARRQRFDEYFRCYPVAMMPGPDREHLNHGGKVILPPSALEKLSRLHISYPMMFEVINGSKGKVSHAGVLEFIAEEGRVYMPYWQMQTLGLETGDLVQLKSTDVPQAQLVKLQWQDPSFLEISDQKAVLEKNLVSFTCLTVGDVFTFAYNDNVYSMAVLEVKPSSGKNAVSVVETDLEVDFAAPPGWEEAQQQKAKAASGTSTPRSGTGRTGQSGMIHTAGSMAESINYASIAPQSTEAAAGARAVSSHFLSAGHKLKTGKAPTPKASTPVAGSSTNAQAAAPAATIRRTNGPQPLRLPENKLFFGYEVKPVPKKEGGEKEDKKESVNFAGQGQTLRKKKGDNK